MHSLTRHIGWPRVWRLFLGLFLWACLAPGTAFLGPAAVQAKEGLSYVVKIEGIEDRELRKLLLEVSDAFNRRESPPANTSLLKRRVDKDIPRLIKALRSYGFYSATVTGDVDESAEPLHVTFLVDPGPPYLLKSFDIEVVGKEPTETLKLPKAGELGVVIGKPGRSKTIVQAGKDLLRGCMKQGFPFPKMTDQKVIVDHADRSMTVKFQIDPGPAARFGKTELVGLKTVNETFLREKIPWKEGDRFNEDLLQKARKRFNETGLFSSTQVKKAESVGKDGLLPMTITVKERKHRSIKAGIKYSTDEGVGAKLGWEHRNFLGKGERLDASLIGSQIAYAAEAGFRKPTFFRSDQSLLLNMRLAEDRPDAFTSRNISSSLLVERSLGKGMKAGAGLGYKYSRVEQLGVEDEFSLISVPGRFTWDTSDDLLDPKRGGRLNFQFAPFYDTLQADLGFVKGYGSYARYLKLTEKPFLVLAGRAAFGTIFGAERDSIPADERFYAGGGGSVRGFAYQFAGPLFDGDPIGGRSLLEFSLEVRVKVTEKVGFVTFIDAGSAFENEIPDFDEKLRLGGGAGVRYYTPIGPLRLDVAVPLNPREDIDDPFQIYVSIGQAF